MAKDFKTRDFSRELLEEWDLPWGADGVEILHDEQIDTRRWNSVNELVFRAPDDGVTYSVGYSRGLTEMQEDHDLWEWQDTITGVQVEKQEVTTIEWVAVRKDEESK